MTRPVVETASGRVRGATITAPAGAPVQRFLGIPYAAPPVADLRWRAPRPAAPWPGVRDALEFGPASPQADSLPSPLPSFRVTNTSEDCLSLNVWTPSCDGSRPVMVWIHGGAYASGGTSQPVHDAARIATEADVVVVTVNYRLGALGFLLLDGDADANCGLRDQLCAVAWVREHAGTFGGDPRRLTVFGESAGAGSILHLLASPLRGALFHRAIVQSGQPRTLSRDEGEIVAIELAVRAGCTRADAAALRRLPVERILVAGAEAALASIGRVGMMPFNPALDGTVCDRTILDATNAGRSDDVALVIGTTRDELRLFPDPTAESLDDHRLARRLSRLPGAGRDSAAAVEVYRQALGSGATNAVIWDAARTDALMHAPNLRIADVRSRRGTPTFVYRFDWDAPVIGAAHAVDVPFTFGTFDREGWGQAVGHDGRADALAQTWRSSWAGFATTGDPSPPGLEWPAYDSRDRATMLFGATGAAVARDPGAVARGLWW